MGKNTDKKRKAQYYQKHGGKRRKYGQLGEGLSGILLTCNNREREAVTESYKLIEEYSEMLYGQEKSDAPKTVDEDSDSENDEEEDIAAALQKEVDSLKTKPKQQQFQQADTGARNVIFIRTTLDDPNHLVDRIFSDSLETKEKKSRFIMRFLPILKTCRAYDENITKTVKDVLEKFIGNGKQTTYCFQIKVRNNDSVSRTHLVDVLGELVSQFFPCALVDLVNAEYTLTVDVIKTIACIGCVANFSKYKKYNLQEITNTAAKKDQSKVEASEKESQNSSEKSARSVAAPEIVKPEGAQDISNAEVKDTEENEASPGEVSNPGHVAENSVSPKECSKPEGNDRPDPSFNATEN